MMTTADALAALAAHPELDLLSQAHVAGYIVDGIAPIAVVRPRSEAGVIAAVRQAAAAGVPVLPWGGGTSVNGGNRLASPCLVIDLAALDQVIEYQPRDRTITAGAGLRLAALAKLVEAEGQLLPLEPPLPERATIGGALASGLSGPRRHRYGSARDLLIGSTAVLADGTCVHSGGRVAKNVAGYDLNKLWVGSAGTLAVITQASFRLWPAPPVTELALLAFPTAKAAHRAAMEIAGSPLQPLSLDLAGPATLAATAVPPADVWWLCIENGGTPAMVERLRGELRAVASRCGAERTVAVRGQEAAGVRGMLRDFGYPAAPDALLLRVVTLPSRLAEAVLATAALQDAPLPALVARAGAGMLLARWSDIEPAAARRVIVRVRAAVAALGGSVAIAHAAAAVKDGLDTWGINGGDVAIMQQVKQVYDPAGLLSPGRAPGEHEH